MFDKKQITVYMEPDMSNSWISKKSLSSDEIKSLQKEIIKNLPHDMKPGAYKFSTRN